VDAGVHRGERDLVDEVDDRALGVSVVPGDRNGQPFRGGQVLQRVRAVTLCQRSGFSLEEIGRLLDGGRPWQALARRKVSELQGRIAELEQTMALLRSALECGCRSLETCRRTAHLAALTGRAERSSQAVIGSATESA
jgi:DNA-binding transcriptional MerR regulator